MATVAFAHFAVDLAAGAFIATLPATVERLGRGGGTFGALVALFSVTALGFQPVLGRLADRVGHRSTAALGAALASLVLMVAVAGQNVAMLTLGVLGGGLAAGAFHPAGAALARRVGADAPGTAVAAFAAAGTVGLALGPVAGIALVDRTSSGMLLLALPAIAIAAVIALDAAPVSETSERTPLRVLGVINSLGHVTVLATLVSIATTAISSTVPLLIASQPGRNSLDITIGIALATFSLAMAIGGVVGSTLAHHTDPRAVLRAGLALGAITAALALLTGPGGVGFVPLLAITGLAVGPAIPLLLVAAQDRLPDDRAAASGVVLGLASGMAGVVFMAIASTHGVVGLRGGVLLAISGLLPAALLTGRVSMTGGRGHLGRLCPGTACGCPLPTLWGVAA